MSQNSSSLKLQRVVMEVFGGVIIHVKCALKQIQEEGVISLGKCHWINFKKHLIR